MNTKPPHEADAEDIRDNPISFLLARVQKTQVDLLKEKSSVVKDKAKLEGAKRSTVSARIPSKTTTIRVPTSIQPCFLAKAILKADQKKLERLPLDLQKSLESWSSYQLRTLRAALEP
jgi:hypothetical protein